MVNQSDLEEFAEIRHRLRSLDLKAAVPKELRGSDVPTNAVMTMIHIGPLTADYAIELCEPGVRAVSIRLPISDDTTDVNGSRGRQ